MVGDCVKKITILRGINEVHLTMWWLLMWCLWPRELLIFLNILHTFSSGHTLTRFWSVPFKTMLHWKQNYVEWRNCPLFVYSIISKECKLYLCKSWMVCSCLLNSSRVLWFVLALNMNFLLFTFEDRYENRYTLFSFCSLESMLCPMCVHMWYDGLCSSNRYRLDCVLWHICQWMYCLQEHAYQ